MKSYKFSINSRIKSFGYAFKGIKTLLKNEHNFRIHTFAAVVVIIMGFIFQVSVTEWLIIVLNIAFVMIVEALNTAIEYICDYMNKNHDHNIGLIKDISAGAVLISSIGAAIAGLIIFVPKIYLLLI